MPKVVDSENNNERNVNNSDRVDKGLAIAEILKHLPWFVWATPILLLFGLIGLSIWHDGILGFTNGLLGWLSLVPVVLGVLCGIKAVVWGHDTYDSVRTKAYNRRLLAAGVEKAKHSVRGAELTNALKQAEVNLAYQIPDIIIALAQNGTAFKYTKGGNLEVFGATVVSQAQNPQGQIGAGPGVAGLLAAPGDLPTKVLYEDIRTQVPKGHILVGIGRAGVETKGSAVGACVWIIGLSGTGKTSTTVLRVEERASDDHYFMGVDPHFFKDDSLFHSIYQGLDGQPGAYAARFILPMARNTEEAKKVIQAFIDEFNGRKSGAIPKPWRKITLLVDEVGSLVDCISEEEEELAKMLKYVVRVCGQEARNFLMGGVFISQQATGLAWLRKMALMVIVHQLLMQSEKELACNGDKAAAKDMEVWPIGRTYVYGVGFQEGARTVQQPYFAGRRVNPVASGDDHQQEEGDSSIVDAEPGDNHTQEEPASNVIPALSGDMRVVYDACQQLQGLNQAINSRDVARITGFGKDKANNLITRLEDMNYIPRRRKAV